MSRKPRTIFSISEKKHLEAEYVKQPYAIGKRLKHIAVELDLEAIVVSTWFRNRRWKEKRLKSRRIKSLTIHPIEDKSSFSDVVYPTYEAQIAHPSGELIEVFLPQTAVERNFRYPFYSEARAREKGNCTPSSIYSGSSECSSSIDLLEGDDPYIYFFETDNPSVELWTKYIQQDWFNCNDPQEEQNFFQQYDPVSNGMTSSSGHNYKYSTHLDTAVCIDEDADEWLNSLFNFNI